MHPRCVIRGGIIKNARTIPCDSDGADDSFSSSGRANDSNRLVEARNTHIILIFNFSLSR